MLTFIEEKRKSRKPVDIKLSDGVASYGITLDLVGLALHPWIGQLLTSMTFDGEPSNILATSQRVETIQ